MKNILFILFLVFTSSVSNSQNDSLPPPEAYFSAIIVSDIESSIKWYSNIFGFKVLKSVESKERGFKQTNLKRENTLIELIELNSSVTPESLLESYPKKTKINGFFKFGFLISEFDKWVNFLKQSKIQFNGTVVIDPISEKKTLLVKDPDGNRIQLFEK